MLVRIKGYLTLSLAIWLLLTYLQTSSGQNLKDNLLDRPVQQLEIKEKDVHSILLKIAYEYDVPIGLEEALTGSELSNKAIRINIHNGNLRDVLDELTAQDPRYEWKLVDGVINVFPKAYRDELLKDILETQVQNLNIKPRTDKLHIRGAITDLPEVKSKLEMANVIPMNIGFTSVDFAPPSREFSLNVERIKVRDILNQILKTSRWRYWIVSRYGDNNEQLVINFF